MLIIIVSSVSLVMAYFFLRPYMQTQSQRMKMLRWGLILVPLAIVAYWIVTYFVFYSIPESFEKGVELIENNKEITSKTGSYQSYSYFDKDLPKPADNPAWFKVSLKGSLATLYLSCKVSKDTLGKWHLIEIKEDSLKKTKSQ